MESSVLGDIATLYDSVRPGYPELVIDQTVRFASLRPGDTVLEVGSGTGKATVLFAGRALSVTGVEPNPSLFASPDGTVLACRTSRSRQHRSIMGCARPEVRAGPRCAVVALG
jgi:SAM-dependent methyltransferase